MKWRILFRWSLAILIIVFLIRYLFLSWGDLVAYDFSLNIGLFLVSYLFVIAHLIFVALGWGLILNLLEKNKLSLLKGIRIRTFADFGRFVPGKVWLVLGRIEMCKKFGLRTSTVTFSTLMEVFMNLLSACLLAVLIFILFVGGELSQYSWYFVIFVPILLIFLHPKLFNLVMKSLSKFLKKDFVRIKAKYYYLLSLLSVFVVAWLLLGVGFYLMVNSLYAIGISNLLTLTAVLAVAWVFGFVMIFVPAGIGFREIALSYLLSFFLPEPIAVLVAILARFWLISGEVLTAFIFWWIR